MPDTQTHRIAWAIAALLLTAGTAQAAVPLGTDFSYQAQLKLDGVPLNDTADFEFSLYDADSLGLLVAGSRQAQLDLVFEILHTPSLADRRWRLKNSHLAKFLAFY